MRQVQKKAQNEVQIRLWISGQVRKEQETQGAVAGKGQGAKCKQGDLLVFVVKLKNSCAQNIEKGISIQYKKAIPIPNAWIALVNLKLDVCQLKE